MSEIQVSTGTVEPATPSEVADSGVNADAPIGFFAIGLAVNLALLTAYGIWAWRRWKRPDPPE